MPAAVLKKIADESGKSEKELEKFWNEAKKAAKEKGFDEDQDRFWAYVVGIVKKRAGIGDKDLSEMAKAAMDDPKYQMSQVVEFVGNEQKVMMIWEKAKDQAEQMVRANRISEDKMYSYAMDILKLGVGYKLKEGTQLTNVDAELDDAKVGEVITKKEWDELKKSGYDPKKLKKKELQLLIQQVEQGKKKEGKKFKIASVVGNLALGFVGGFAAVKAIDSFFTMMRSK